MENKGRTGLIAAAIVGCAAVLVIVTFAAVRGAKGRTESPERPARSMKGWTTPDDLVETMRQDALKQELDRPYTQEEEDSLELIASHRWCVDHVSKNRLKEIIRSILSREQVGVWVLSRDGALAFVSGDPKEETVHEQVDRPCGVEKKP
jgi:hypothetical protein